MSQEQFDIVDENNQLLGIQKPRSIVHSKILDWHRATHIWIVNDQGKVLCQQRSLTKDANPGKWQSFFGGHVIAGQTYDQNAVQELKEELGLNIQVSDLTSLYIRKSESARHFSQVYVMRWNGDASSFQFDKGEVAYIRWFTMSELEEAMKNSEFCNGIDEKVVELSGWRYPKASQNP